jgi:hypothetical protein
MERSNQSNAKRFSEPAKFLPVAFVCFTISTQYFIYVIFHCIPMMQFDVNADHRDDARRTRGIWQTIVFHIVTFLLVLCYVRSIMEHPGEIPDDDAHWQYTNDGGKQSMMGMGLHETKKSGERRHCKWCGKYKPDRCHHCRVCRTCILKMDHHCPWIYNCVGFYNYKFFFLLLFYSVICLQLMMWTMAESVMRSWDVDTPFIVMFFVLFGETLSIFLGVLLTAFFSFHIWLMLKSMTTIEFCEKKMPKKAPAEGTDSGISVYDLGCYGNICAVLGNNPLFWPLPISPHGYGSNGLQFQTNEDDAFMTRGYEVGRGKKKKGHTSTQRPTSSRQIPQMQYGTAQCTSFC